jgi:hypothetical protein
MRCPPGDVLRWRGCKSATTRQVGVGKRLKGGVSVVVWKRKAVGIGATGLMALGLLVAPPAMAENYAPGLPPAVAGQPNNPANPARIGMSIVLVRDNVANRCEVREGEASPSLGTALLEPARVGRCIALSLEGNEQTAAARNLRRAVALTPGSTWVVSIKRAGNGYDTLGSTVVAADGKAVLPVFRVTRPGLYILNLRNVQTGQVAYVKVRARN